jgi:hypothetical protein
LLRKLKELKMTKTYRFAGVAREPKQNGVPGEFRVRYMNSLDRVKLMRNQWGNTDIDIIELKEPLDKVAAAQYLLNIGFDAGDVEVKAALEAVLFTVPAVKPCNTRAKPGKLNPELLPPVEDLLYPHPDMTPQEQLAAIKADQAQRQSVLDNIRARLDKSRAPKFKDIEDAPF